ncbi:MAG TPA: hypothetical protein DEP66_02825 [Acidimicrobiaceae bacterium]|nr:hypothetical protein [Acidimicrobiaceae bacterium]HCB37156.1 hypothetical protein [Acidimicrobiaceae bacterium]
MSLRSERGITRPARAAWPARTALVAAAAAVALVAAGCGSAGQTAIERELQSDLERKVAPAVIADVDCPDDAPLGSGSTFLCDAQVEGQYYEAEVTIIDAQGRFEVARRHAVLNVIRTEASLATDAGRELGRDVRADCGESEYLVVMVASKVNCTLSEVDTGAAQDIIVEVLSADATFDWSLVLG